MGYMGFRMTVSCFVFSRLASRLRLATSTLHRLHRQTNMVADHTTHPLRSLAVLLSTHRSEIARSIRSDDSEHVGVAIG